MTLNEAIKHAEEVADKKEREKQKWERWLENDSDYRAVAEKVSCELCAKEHKQLAEWLKELKRYKEYGPCAFCKHNTFEESAPCFRCPAGMSFCRECNSKGGGRMTREEAKIFLYSISGDLGFTDVENYTCKDGEKMREAIKALEQAPWIPVSERLPEDGIYLVTVERIAGEPRIETKSFAKDLNRVDDYDFPEHKCGWYDYDSEYGYWEDTNVIAWMPLPQPYEPQESEVKE